VTFALVVHLAALGLLIIAAPGLMSGPRGERAISVELAPPAHFLTRRTHSPPRAAPPRTPPIAAPNVEGVAPPPPASVATVSPPPAIVPTNPPQQSGAAGLALRNSIIGCSFAETIPLSEAQRRHCRDAFAAGPRQGPDLSRFALAAATKAVFDAAADRENFLQKPFLSARPKNGCKPFVDHQQYASLGGSRDAYSVSFGCGKTF
jgi:hypothetical protein